VTAPVVCPSCSRALFPEDVFCSGCGTRIRARDTSGRGARGSLVRRTIPTAERETCGSCHGFLLPGDLFCPSCGARARTDPARIDENLSDLLVEVTRASGGKYELVCELGRGGMGVVFLARDVELERPVAVKVLSPGWLSDEAMVQRFRREARTIARFRHESIITVYDEGRAGNLCYFVMDYIEGASLSRILRTVGPLSVSATEAILYRVGSGLDYAHAEARGVVHRDVKPSNILIDTDGLAVLMDFGIARDAQGQSGLTRTGMVMGTPEYMSPEQGRGHSVTAASDQYSLGAVVYAMLTGAPPFTGPFYQVLVAHESEPVPPILGFRPDCPPALAEAVERMLAKHPTDRWPSIRAALQALGLRPLPPGDQALEEIAGLVRGSVGPSVAGAVTDASSVEVVPPRVVELGIDPPTADVREGESSRPRPAPHPARRARGAARAWVGAPVIVVVGATSWLLGTRDTPVRAPMVADLMLLAAGEAVPNDRLALVVGDTVRLAARAVLEDGTEAEWSASWLSEDPAVAAIDPSGILVAHAEGVTRVVAAAEGAERVLDATVEPSRAALTLRAGGRSEPAGPITLRPGESIGLEPGLTDRYGRPASGEVAWRSTDPAVATVDRSGRIMARSSGRAVVSAAAGALRHDATVIVLPPADPAPAPRPAPAPGTLVLRIAPSWANVFINGVAHGERTSLEVTLPAGRHALRLEHPRMEIDERSITIEPEGRTEVNVRMRERSGG
jgi:eukaryotic-like serine/threonine-protein kinase